MRLKEKKTEAILKNNDISTRANLVPRQEEALSSVAQTEELTTIPFIEISTEVMPPEEKLVEITDNNILAHIDYLLPGFVQTGVAANTATQVAKTGTLYIDDDIPNEVSVLFSGRKTSTLNWTARDIHPGEKALIIARDKTGISFNEMKWGFPQYSGKGLFINARAETALQKKTFSESVLYRRCVIPARHFYELPKYPAESAGGRFCRRDASKIKVTFLRENSSVLYMAGFFNMIQDEPRFVVLITQANQLVSLVHDRMPLILEAEDVENWIYDGSRTQAFLQKAPLAL